MSYQQTIFDAIREGELLRDQGLNQAVSHAVKVDPEWKEKVWSIFINWISGKPKGYFFLMEDFRRQTENELPAPPSLRAFGFVSIKAAKQGLVFQRGTAKVKNPRARCANAAVWVVK